MRNSIRRTSQKRSNLAEMLRAVGQDGAPARLFWWSVLLLTVALQIAESVIPTGGGGNLSSSVDDQLAQMQGNSIRQVCYIVVVLVGVGCFTRLKGYKIEWRYPLAPICAAVLGWCALSLIWAEDPNASIKRLVAYLFMVTGATGITLLWSRKQILQFMSLFGAAGVTFGLVVEILLRTFKPWVSDYRFAGTEHENVQGFCCMQFAMASLAASDADPQHKNIFRGLAVYGAAFMLLTKCRSCLLGLGVALLLYVLLTRPLVTKIWVSATLLTGGLVLYMTDILTPLLGFVSRNGEGLDDLTGRAPVWELAHTFISRRPLTGYGYQSFWTASHIDDFSSAFGWQISSAHNSYLEMILALGYGGMILHVTVLVLGVIMGVIYYRRTRLPIYALASAMFAALLLIGYLESAVLISTGPYHFGLTLLMASLCFEPIFHGAPGEFTLRPQRRRVAGRNGLAKSYA